MAKHTTVLFSKALLILSPSRPPQVGQLEETDQVLPIDTLAIVLKPNRRLIHVWGLPPLPYLAPGHFAAFSE
jgi:hypothetical protein